jgi:hypothetical protein
MIFDSPGPARGHWTGQRRKLGLPPRDVEQHCGGADRSRDYEASSQHLYRPMVIDFQKVSWLIVFGAKDRRSDPTWDGVPRPAGSGLLSRYWPPSELNCPFL